MRLSIIAAMDRHRVIGRDGDLPWRLSSDLRRFKRLTMGHPMIMGRRTYESIPRQLPGRLCIVVSRQQGFELAPGAVLAGSWEEALREARESGAEEAFVIGGASIYEVALKAADRLHLTEVEAQLEGDVHFPELDLAGFRLLEEEQVPADAKNEYPSTYRLYERRRPAAGPLHE